MTCLDRVPGIFFYRREQADHRVTHTTQLEGLDYMLILLSYLIAKYWILIIRDEG